MVFRMLRILIVIFLSLFLNINAYASKFSAKQGDTVENEVSFGNDKFPLPEGKFLVAIVSKWLDFRDVLLVQIDEDTGIIRWKIKLTATGNKSEKYSAWLPGPMCKLNTGYFVKVKKGSSKFACWLVESSDSEPKLITRTAKSNNFFSFGDIVYHKIKPTQGISEKIREFESQKNIKLPDMFFVSRHQYAKKARLYESEYYYNPEVDGIPEPENLEWERNEFHKQRIKNFPDHEAFLNKFISVSGSLIDRFNQLNKVRGAMTLDASNYVVQASMNAQTSGANNETSKESIVDQIKQLKELLDAGVLTKEEFEKAKKQILN
jgi:hypothetical protein